jgi:sugar O-acyltransferase (sialic acid O-acetyltransferase NeuD family)
MSKKLLLFPYGGNARESLLSVFAVNEIQEEWNIVGFIDDDPSQYGKDCCGIKVIGGRDMLKEIPDAFVLAVPGSPTSYLRRKDIIGSLQLDQSRFASIIHPSAVLAPDAVIGHNTIVMPNVIISCGVRIGSHCILLPNSVVSHDSVVGDYCCIGSNVSISGSVTIGSECYIGSGVKVRESVRIGNRSLVGLGSNVISDIEESIVVVGNPAKSITTKAQ